MVETAAVVFVGLSIAVAGFQVALVLGAPWGEFTLGGRVRGVLPGRLRAVAAASAVLMLGFAMVIATRAGLLSTRLEPSVYWGAWFVVAYCAIGTVMNGITPSRRERRLWLPVVLAMLVCSTVVALP